MRFLFVFVNGSGAAQLLQAGCHPQFQTNDKLYRSCKMPGLDGSKRRELPGMTQAAEGELSTGGKGAWMGTRWD